MSDLIMTEDQFEEAVYEASRRELLRVKRAADKAIAGAMSELIIDPDGDRIEVREVFGMGEPMLCLRAEQEGHEASVNLTVADAIRLRDFLAAFIAEPHRCRT